MIPRSALFLGLAGLIPFLFGAGLALSPEPNPPEGTFAFVYPQDAYAILAGYGIVILCFMSGVLWGFATKAGDRQSLCYTLSVIPALWAFFATGAGATQTALVLIAGFIGLLGLDWLFSKWDLTPDWWMSLRILLTAVVVISLAFGIQI